MNILTPITKSEDVKSLIESGANEFYAGILINWNERYHMINSINRRYYKSSNFSCLKDLKNAIKIMNRYNVPLFITLNSPYYVPEQYFFLKNYIKKLINIGVSGFIVSDIELIKHIKKKNPNTEVHLSTISNCINVETFKYFQKFNVDRIVLPREFTINEIKEIQKDTNIKMEAFYSPLDCQNIDGYCEYQHIKNSKCVGKRIETFYNYNDSNKILKNLNIQNCRLCQIYDLYMSNIASIKIIGRGDSLSRTKTQISTLFKIINFLKTNKKKSKKDFFNFIQNIILKETSFQCNPNTCLYKI